MRFRTRMIAVLMGAGFLLAGYLANGGSVVDVARAQSAAGEVVDVARAQSAAGEVDDVRAGRILFEENCVACHQAGAGGKSGLAPSLVSKEFLAAASDRFLKKTIKEGREGTSMMPFGEVLKDTGIHAIIAYLRSGNRTHSQGMALDHDRQAMGDPRLGKHWFSQVCAGCHGPNGEGYVGAGSGTAIGKRGFLSAASDGFIRYIIKNGRSNTAMRGFSGPDALASLNDREIDDIISYLRILE